MRGNGYTSEGARALIQYAYESLDAHRVIATCQPENPAWWRVKDKLGMRREAHFASALPVTTGRGGTSSSTRLWRTNGALSQELEATESPTVVSSVQCRLVGWTT